MDLEMLDKHIHNLVALDETEASVASCYLGLERGEDGYRNYLDERVRLTRKRLRGKRRRDFDSALDRIEGFLGAQLLADAKSTAIFARAGEKPFFLPLQFRVPLPNWFVVDSAPNVHRLVELRRACHRYVVMLSCEDRVRILEVTFGSVTEDLQAKRPELRRREGREWTQERYQSHRQERTNAFLKEMIRALERLMTAGGHAHFILAGNPRITSSVENALPKHLAAKRIATLEVSAKQRASEIVRRTLSFMVEQKEGESAEVVSRLCREVNTDGLAVVGAAPCLTALERGQADVLVMAREYTPKPTWKCGACGKTHVSHSTPKTCPECGKSKVHEIDVREELVRLAERRGCKVEIARGSDVLTQLGGVGCLVRYLTSQQ